MAEGGEELETYVDIYDEPPDDAQQETSFIDDDAQYNTDENFIDDPSFSAHTRITSNVNNLEKAIKNTGWRYTNTGLRMLAKRVYIDGDNLYYAPPSWDIFDKMNEFKKESLREKGFLKIWKGSSGKIEVYALV